MATTTSTAQMDESPTDESAPPMDEPAPPDLPLPPPPEDEYPEDRDVEAAASRDVDDEAGSDGGGGFFSDMKSAMLCAFVVAPILMIGAVILLGWNEKHTFCDEKAYVQGKQAVKEVNCDQTSEDGKLVLFSCPIKQDKNVRMDADPKWGDWTNNVDYKGPILKLVGEVYQCIETKSANAAVDVTELYSYTVEWVEVLVDSSKYSDTAADKVKRSNACGAGFSANTWPAGTPKSEIRYASDLYTGPYIIPRKDFNWNLNPQVEVKASSLPSGWGQRAQFYMKPPDTPQIGHSRVRFYAIPKDEVVTVMGENNGGKIKPWEADGSWLCDPQDVYHLSAGKMSESEVFERHKASNQALAWCLRFVGFFMLWFAWSLLAQPCGVMADCIPCIGEFLSSAVELLACFVAYFPACVCTLLVVCIVWVAVRPVLCSILFVIAFIGLGVIIYLKCRKRNTLRRLPTATE